MTKEEVSIQLSDHFDYPTLMRFTIPSVLMMVISSVYSIVDGLFVSNFAGSDGFAAVNLMMPIAMMISCIGFMAGAGGSALISKIMAKEPVISKPSMVSCWINLSYSSFLICPMKTANTSRKSKSRKFWNSPAPHRNMPS